MGLKNKWVFLAFCAAFCSSVSSLSFTAWVGIGATCACFSVLWLLKFSRKLVIVAVLMLFCGFGFMTNKLYNTDVAARQDEEDSEKGQSVQDSMLVRAKIVQNCMPFAAKAGMFGWGNTIRHSQLALESVDNSYMLFTMRRGFVFISMFLIVGHHSSLRDKLKRCRTDIQAVPLAIAVSVILGIMAAMFTVWFGFAYSVMWVMMIGICHSMCDALIFGAPRTALVPQTNGYAAMQQRGQGRRRSPCTPDAAESGDACPTLSANSTHAHRPGGVGFFAARRNHLRPAPLDAAQRHRASRAGGEPGATPHVLFPRFQLLRPQQRAVAAVSVSAGDPLQVFRRANPRRIHRRDGDQFHRRRAHRLADVLHDQIARRQRSGEPACRRIGRCLAEPGLFRNTCAGDLAHRLVHCRDDLFLSARHQHRKARAVAQDAL